MRSDVNTGHRFARRARWLFKDASPEARRARGWIKIIFILGLFLCLFWIIPIRSVAQAILAADRLYFWAGVLLSFIGTVFTAFQMEPLVRKQGIRHGRGSILAINLSVKFYNQFLPTTLLASGLRWHRLSQPGNKTAEALAALAFYRLLETFLTFALGLGFWLGSGREPDLLTMLWLVGLCGAVIAAWIGVTRWSLPVYRFLEVRMRIDRQPALRPLTAWLEKMSVAVSTYSDMRARDLFLSVFWGVVSALFGIFSGQVIGWAVGIDLSFMEMGWIQAVMLVTMQLPFSVAGGLGVREVTLVALLATFGISPDLALAYSFLLLIRGALLSLPGGVIEVARALGDRRKPEHAPDCHGEATDVVNH